MNKLLILLIIPLLCFSQSKKEPKVIGIGGVFFKSENPKELKKWYQDNLGIITDEYGSMFKSRNINRSHEINYLQWSPFHEKTTYFHPSSKEFMINYRVQNIEELVENLRQNGITILDEIVEYDEYGKFIHILDSEGNKIELWEQPIRKRFINWEK